MDMTSIQAAATSLNAAVNIANGLLQLKISSEVQTKIGELNAKILSAQTSALAANVDQFALLERVRELEEEVRRAKAWEAEKEKYELCRHEPGIHTRRLKANASGGEIPHEICTNCYSVQKVSPLHIVEGAYRTKELFCPACKTSLSFTS